MTGLVPFNYEGISVRTITVDGESEFVAADVCRVLDHSNPSVAVAGLDDDERGLRNVETPSGEQQMVTVTEGLHGGRQTPHGSGVGREVRRRSVTSPAGRDPLVPGRGPQTTSPVRATLTT